MAKQTPVNISVDENNPDKVNILVGTRPYQIDKTVLFDRKFDEVTAAEHAKHNLRLCYIIGSYTNMASREFRRAANNQTFGMRLKDDNYFITSIRLIDPEKELYEVNFGEQLRRRDPDDDMDENDIDEPEEDMSKFKVVTSDQELAQTLNDPSIVLNNISSYLRTENANQLTPTVLETLNSKLFWY